MGAQLNKLAYITGSSKGIGLAITKLLLKDGFHVIGLSRSNDFEHPNFQFQELDLNNLRAVQSFNFEKSAEKVILINNAGLVGDINPIGSVDNQQIEAVMNVNTIAPQILTNKFVKRFQNDKGHFHVLNISSGAGKKAIDAWATYCASKAAIDLFSETVAEELEWRGHHNFRIHSCAPGVVDTNMQSDIRSASESSFKLVNHFKELKSNNELASTDEVAIKLKMIIDQPDSFPSTLLSVRDF
ncbi:MAG: SDR family NAD(P)-dependent oxidoreductase [Crocinitomicaceae bacterium]